MPHEFDLIAQYFAPLAGVEGLGLTDDAACFPARPGYDLIISKDMLVGGVHFFDDVDPIDLAAKSIAVNMSDLAAKGAVPAQYFLGISLPPSINEKWLQVFSTGLEFAQSTYGIKLAGGDTTSTSGPLTVSITALGYVKEGTMIKRSGACIDDDVYVTGTLGDAALGLKVVEGLLPRSDFLVARYHRPTARHTLGPDLVGIATAAADVSDGLLADLGHICKASNVGMRIHKQKVPLSPSAAKALSGHMEYESLIFCGGDDYEIVFTAPQTMRQMLDRMNAQIPTPITRIGLVEQLLGVRLVDKDDNLLQVAKTGFQHF